MKSLYLCTFTDYIRYLATLCLHNRLCLHIKLNNGLDGFVFYANLSKKVSIPQEIAGKITNINRLGLCGIAGAIAASGAGRYVPKVGILRMSVFGGCLQLAAWIVAWLFRDSYIGLASAIILADVGAQCMQVSNQSGSLRQLPQATNRVNTIFMTIFFIGSSLGTFSPVWAGA